METCKAPLLRLYDSIANKRECRLHYTVEEKDMSLYQFIMAGNKYHEFMGKNIPGISRSTLLRHLDAHTQNIQAGKNVRLKHYIL